MKKNKKWILNVILLFSTIMVMLFLIELFSFMIIQFLDITIPLPFSKDEERIYIHFYENMAPSDDMGTVLKKNDTHREFVFSSGKLVYDVRYTTDQYGRRTINQAYIQNNSHLLLFGGSFTYGEGLNDNETLQYMLGKGLPGYNVYNYAVYGYGPQHMLALLEKRNLPQEVESSDGLALYVFNSNHIDRAAGSTRAWWTFNYPYYYLNSNGTLQRKGSFKTGRPFITLAYTIFLKVKEKSNFLKLINLDLPMRVSDKHFRLTYEIIAKSKKLYEEQFNGTFYVLIHPLSTNSNSSRGKDAEQSEILIKILEKNNVPVLYYPINNSRQYTIPNEGHPNGKLNQFLSSKLIEDLNKLKKR